MQNDRLDLTIILAEKKMQKKSCILRYLHFFDNFSSLILQISLNIGHFSHFFFSKNDREIEPVVLHTINPMNSTKWVTSFSWIFHFSLIDFSKKIFEILFSQMPDALGVCGTMCKVKKKKIHLGGRHGLLRGMLGLE